MNEVYTDLEKKNTVLEHIQVVCVLKPYQHKGNGYWEVTFKGEKCIVNSNKFKFVLSEADSINDIYQYINIGEIISMTIENTNNTSIPIGYLIPLKDEFAQKAMEDTANYYKNILKTTAEYIDDFINVMKGENVDNFYQKGRTVTIIDLERLLSRLKAESYGAS